MPIMSAITQIAAKLSVTAARRIRTGLDSIRSITPVPHGIPRLYRTTVYHAQDRTALRITREYLSLCSVPPC